MKTIQILNITIEYDSGNVRIKDSYKIRKVEDMIIILSLFKIRTNYNSKRNLKSWLKEWKTHNRLHRLGLYRSHTKDCDLEENEKLHRLIAYKILGI